VLAILESQKDEKCCHERRISRERDEGFEALDR
jgi:hypothetical protein